MILPGQTLNLQILLNNRQKLLFYFIFILKRRFMSFSLFFTPLVFEIIWTRSDHTRPDQIRPD